MAKLAIYRVLELDVWGNKFDGFELNEAHRTNRLYEIDFEDDEQILAQLKASGELVGFTIDDIEIEGDVTCLYIEHAETSKPLLHLEFVEEI